MTSTTRGEIVTALSLCQLLHRTYWSGSGCDEFVVHLLTHLRHFCDEQNLNFGLLDRRAYQHYLDEREPTGEPPVREPVSPMLNLHIAENAFTSIPGTTGRRWLQARVSANGVAHDLWAVSVTAGLGIRAAMTEDISTILGVVRSSNKGNGRLRTVRLYGDEYVLLLVPSIVS